MGKGNLRIKVKFFAYIRDLFEGKERDVEIETGATVRELLDLLCDSPELRKEIFKGREVNPNLVIFKKGASIQSLNGLETDLSEGDTINIFPFIGGG
jgi:molybdopterin synthase sulfur carrier subunit